MQRFIRPLSVLKPARLLAVRPAVQGSVRQRLFHAGRQVSQAQQPPQPDGISPEVLEKLQNSEAVQKIMNDPELFSKFVDLAQYLQKSGLVDGGAAPSPWQVMKLLSHKEAREKLSSFAEACTNAGVKFDSQEMTELIKNMNK